MLLHVVSAASRNRHITVFTIDPGDVPIFEQEKLITILIKLPSIVPDACTGFSQR